MARRGNLVARLYPVYAASILVAGALIALSAFSLLRGAAYEDGLAGIEVEARIAASAVVELSAADPSLAAAQRFASDLGKGSGTRITLIDAGGRVLGDSEADPAAMDDHSTRPEVREALALGEGKSIRLSATIKDERAYVAFAAALPGGRRIVVRASRSIPPIDRRLGGMFLGLGSVVAGLLAAVAAVTWAYGRKVSRRLDGLAAAAARFSAGELSYRAAPGGSEDIRAIARGMNAMAGQLEARIAEIEAGKAEAEAMLGGLEESVCFLGADLRILRLNRAARELLSSRAAAREGRSLLECFPSAELAALARRALESGRDPVDGEITLYDPAPVHLRVHARAMGEGAGERLLLVLSDVTRLLRLETVRRDFVANVSHELRTPITAIKGFVETLRAGGLDDRAGAERFLAIVDKHAARLEAIVEDLLALARLEQGEKEGIERARQPLLPVLQAVAQSFAEAAAAKGISIAVEGDGAGAEGSFNRGLLEQALSNLVDNAIKYSPEGTPVALRARAAAGGFVVEVADKGRGIKPADQARLFERFYRADKARSRELGGTGLGLAIVKHIAQAHGGSASVESYMGEGSVFRLEIPGS